MAECGLSNGFDEDQQRVTQKVDLNGFPQFEGEKAGNERSEETESEKSVETEILHLESKAYAYLDRDDAWLSSPSSGCPAEGEPGHFRDITAWFNKPFDQIHNNTKMALINKLDELYSPSKNIDTRTWTRNKRNSTRKESLHSFVTNGYSNGFRKPLASIAANDKGEELVSPEGSPFFTQNQTFELTGKAPATGTWTGTGNNKPVIDLNSTFDVKAFKELKQKELDMTFELMGDVHPNGDLSDFEEIARRQEETLRRRCSTLTSPPRGSQPSPPKSSALNVTNNLFNGTITKCRLNTTASRTAYALIDDFCLLTEKELSLEGLDDGICSPDPVFLPPHHCSGDPFMSTPLPLEKNRANNATNRNSFQRNVNFEEALFKAPQPFAPQIMPDVSNMRATSAYGETKIGRSLPNLARGLRISGAPKANPSRYPSSSSTNCSPSKQPSHVLSSNISSNANKGGTGSIGGSNVSKPGTHRVLGGTMIRQPKVKQEQPRAPTYSGRSLVPPTSGPPMNKALGSESVSNGSHSGTVTLTRNATFRVRPVQVSNSEENIRCSSRGSNDSNGSGSGSGGGIGRNGGSLAKCGPLQSVTNIQIPYEENQSNLPQEPLDEPTPSQPQPLKGRIPRNASKIPGPKSIVRSGIPVSGGSAMVRMLPAPSGNRVAPMITAANGFHPTEGDKSWSNGCF